MDIEDAARGFCHIIETASNYNRDAFLEDVVRALSSVIAAGAALPPIELAEDASGQDYQLPEVPDDVWHERFRAIGRVIADWDIYWTVDPLSIDEGADPHVTAGDINDDLADIWRDLKEGLMALDQGGPEADILWQWRWGYYNHWGEHATQGLAVLHARLSAIHARD